MSEEKNATIQVEIGQLELAAKDCKLSVEEARKIWSEINAIRGHISSCSEQRAEVAKLVEKRELQIQLKCKSFSWGNHALISSILFFLSISR